MITGAQIRMARSAVRWSAAVLANKCGITERTIIRLEAVDGVPPSRSNTLVRIQSVFEDAGVEFIGSPDDAPGIRVPPD